MPSDKKRKRALEDDGAPSEPGFFKISSIGVSKNQAGPVLASFPAIDPPESTPYKSYHVSNEGDDEVAPLIAGEAETVEFYSNTEETRLANEGCRYMIAAHNKRTNETILYPAAIPLHVLARQVKAHKALKLTDPTAFEYKDARTLLGQTFGTKKAQAAIRAEERNRVDVSAMEGVAPILQQGIEARTGALPTTEQAKEDADAARLIPPYDAETNDASEVYKLHDIIPEPEWKALNEVVTMIISTKEENENEREFMSMFPERRSEWLSGQIRKAFGQEKSKRKQLKILFYISAMMAFRRHTEKKGGITKDMVQDRIQAVPTVIIESLVTRFMEQPRDSDKYHSTSNTQTLLLTHMFALCLRTEKYFANTDLLATSLSMSVNKVNTLFKSLGCKIEVPKDKDRVKLGIPPEENGTKWAILRAPVVFPKARTKRQGGR